ncbi:MAG: type VI secretion system protein TssA [Ideonella sp.]
MAFIDIDALLAPVGEAKPAGENLEYAEVAELERQSTGSPGKLDPATREMVGGEEPEWRKVRDLALSIFAQTKDLRVAIILTRALLALHGLAGFGEGMQLIARMSEQYWDTAHPMLDAGENNDPIERLNALANLDDGDGMIKSLRATRIVESREAGFYTVRDLDMTVGRIAPEAGKQAPTKALLEVAWRTGEPEANAARRGGVSAGLQAANGLIKLFRDKSNDAPSIDTLRDYLKRLKEFYDEVANDAVPEAAEAAEVTAEGAVVATPGGGAKAGGALASRADAINTLEQVATYVRKTEPSSPAPMFIDRAVKMLQADFAAIVRELAPDSKERIEMLGGTSLDEKA